jgi:RimJ/RimL family protein N-acetyltransferase
VVAITAPDNVGSIAVLERIGFKFERMMRLADDREELRLFASTWPADPR